MSDKKTLPEIKINKIVLVSGSRKCNDFKLVREKLLEAAPDMIVHGSATGADQIADSWAITNRIPRLAWPADWDAYRYIAGPVRNVAIFNVAQHLSTIYGAELSVLAFPGPNSIGTIHAIELAKERELKLDIYEVKK